MKKLILSASLCALLFVILVQGSPKANGFDALNGKSGLTGNIREDIQYSKIKNFGYGKESKPVNEEERQIERRRRRKHRKGRDVEGSRLIYKRSPYGALGASEKTSEGTTEEFVARHKLEEVQRQKLARDEEARRQKLARDKEERRRWKRSPYGSFEVKEKAVAEKRQEQIGRQQLQKVQTRKLAIEEEQTRKLAIEEERRRTGGKNVEGARSSESKQLKEWNKRTVEANRNLKSPGVGALKEDGQTRKQGVGARNQDSGVKQGNKRWTRPVNTDWAVDGKPLTDRQINKRSTNDEGLEKFRADLKVKQDEETKVRAGKLKGTAEKLEREKSKDGPQNEQTQGQGDLKLGQQQTQQADLKTKHNDEAEILADTFKDQTAQLFNKRSPNEELKTKVGAHVGSSEDAGFEKAQAEGAQAVGVDGGGVRLERERARVKGERAQLEGERARVDREGAGGKGEKGKKYPILNAQDQVQSNVDDVKAVAGNIGKTAIDKATAIKAALETAGAGILARFKDGGKKKDTTKEGAAASVNVDATERRKRSAKQIHKRSVDSPTGEETEKPLKRAQLNAQKKQLEIQLAKEQLGKPEPYLEPAERKPANAKQMQKMMDFLKYFRPLIEAFSAKSDKTT